VRTAAAIMVPCAVLVTVVCSLSSSTLHSRRAVATAAASAAASSLLPPGHCVSAPPSVASVGEILETTAMLPQDARCPISLVLRPDYGIETADVFYPRWVLGKWRVTSTVKSAFAPAGIEVFAPGRNGTEALRRARAEAPLTYDVRWRLSRGVDDAVVVDREYNTASISRASMGPNAVQDVQEDGADHLTLVLKPDGAPASSLFAADLRVVSRRTDPYPLIAERPNWFGCAETTRQTVTSIAGEKAAPGKPKSPLVKEIETLVTYEVDANNPEIMRGYQRTATFLVPDATYTGDPSIAELAAQRLTRAPNGRLVAVDVRVYALEYRRL